MGLNVSTSMTFENREFLRNTAKNILTSKGASKEISSKIVDNTIFNNKELYSNAQLDALKASVQYTLSRSLKETNKYIKKHSKEENKKHILGELFKSLEINTDSDEELFDIVIDYSRKNIFEAA